MPSSVCAQTTATAATLPLVIHILRPVSTQSVPSRFAYVRIAAGSEPTSGSVRPKQPISSPAAMPGSQRCFCSSEPYFQIAYIAREPWTETSERIPESAASSSRQAVPYCTALAPSAAVAREGHPERADRAELAGEVPDAGEFAVLVPLGDVRQHPVGGPAADGVAHGAVLVAEELVEAERIGGQER